VPGLVTFYDILTRAVPNRESLLFNQIQIIKTIIRPNRICMNFKAMSLSFIIINVTTIIQNIHSCSAASVY